MSKLNPNLNQTVVQRAVAEDQWLANRYPNLKPHERRAVRKYASSGRHHTRSPDDRQDREQDVDDVRDTRSGIQGIVGECTQGGDGATADRDERAEPDQRQGLRVEVGFPPVTGYATRRPDVPGRLVEAQASQSIDVVHGCHRPSGGSVGGGCGQASGEANVATVQITNPGRTVPITPKNAMVRNLASR